MIFFLKLIIKQSRKSKLEYKRWDCVETRDFMTSSRSVAAFSASLYKPRKDINANHHSLPAAAGHGLQDHAVLMARL